VDSNTSQREDDAARDLESSWTKVVGKPYAGEPHVRFEVAGVGNVATVELWTHPAIERAGLETLHLPQARQSSTLPVDQDGNILDVLVQRVRDQTAAKQFFRKRLKDLTYIPRVIITDQLRRYGATIRESLPSIEHRQHRYLNNRAENSH
jgi:hypothetical protein